jgi:hypothetical protein
VTRRSILALLLVLSAVQPTLAGKGDPPPDYTPDVESALPTTLQGSTWVGGGGEWNFWLKELDDTERLNFIERTTGLAVDPFLGRPDQPPAYHTFLLVLENNSSGQLSFNPASCWLKTSREKVLLPRGVTDVSFNYRMTGRELPAAYGKALEAIFDQTVTIDPGRKVSGLLVYERVPQNTKRWHVGLRLILPDGERGAFDAPYIRIKKNGKGTGG